VHRMSRSKTVRQNYHQFIISNLGDGDFNPAPARQPTKAIAGSEEKIEMMRRRVELGEDLYHPKDSTFVKVRDQRGQSKA
jgi:hypothetical protein